MNTGTAILATAVLERARARGLKITTAESCTGGMVAAALTAIPGSSDVVDRGFVTYSNDAKMQMLGVEAATLDAVGAVSEPVAGEMARGALTHSGADLSVSVTGIAGPGGSEFKPEGRVCFGVALRGTGEIETRVETIEFGAAGRDQVRHLSTLHALERLLQTLKRLPSP